MKDQEYKAEVERRLYNAGYRYIQKSKNGYYSAHVEDPRNRSGIVLEEYYPIPQCLIPSELETDEAYEIPKPPIDWSKVPIDTKVLVKDIGGNRWYRRYFARYDANNSKYPFLVFGCGATSWNSSERDLIGFMECKLAEE